jgi:peptide/nickel transport system permease protein
LAQLVGRRLVQLVPILIGVSFINFALLNLLPGNIAYAILGASATPEGIAKLTRDLHLDAPFFERYWIWASSELHGDFGISFLSGQPVSAMLATRLPVTIELLVLALVLAVGLAVVAALASALSPGSPFDRALTALTALTLSVPTFVIGVLLILVLAIEAKLLPALGFVPFGQNPLENLRSIILPAFTLAAHPFCVYTRLLRGDLVDQMNRDDYVQAARARGLSLRAVLAKHVLRNASFGLITVVGLNVGIFIGGTALVESIFALPGMGQLLISSIGNHDVPVIQAIVLIAAVTTVVANLIADLIYEILDPRVRYGGAGD